MNRAAVIRQVADELRNQGVADPLITAVRLVEFVAKHGTAALDAARKGNFK